MQGRIEMEHEITDGRFLRLFAEDIRKERTGVHAKITLAVENDRLAWTTLNIERDEDRVRLSNSAHKNMHPIDAQQWPQENMRRALSNFCAGLWNEHVGSIAIGPMAGKRRLEGPAFAARPYIIIGGGTMVYAPPGRGKSFSAMLQAVSVDAGYDGIFNVPKAYKSLYINIERSEDSMRDRLARVNDCLGLPEDRPLDFINARGKSLHDISDAIKRFVDQEGTEVVWLDSISRAGFGDLNENQPVNRIIDTLNATVPTWVALAHTPRNDESHIYGSVHFEAGIDIGVKMTTEIAANGMTIGVAWTITKANDAPTGGKPLMYALEFDETGLQAVRTPRMGEFLALEAKGPQSPQAALQATLLALGEATAGMLAEALGMDRANVSRELNAASWARKRKVGREVWFSVYAVQREPV